MRRQLGLAVLALATVASAMNVRENSRSLGKSADGKSELFEDVARGPEGGGSITFRVTGDPVQKFIISSDFSPGGGDTPQTVSEKVCREKLAALAELLTTRGFPGFAVNPDVCAKKNRSGAVSAGQKPK